LLRCKLKSFTIANAPLSVCRDVNSTLLAETRSRLCSSRRRRHYRAQQI
jgi:hypothetical protein